ncbi:hypothetical protein CEXT_241671 [Caerostris extrusa]|uniref:Uncharacterized protein n=1 Tax=Caerostris extrusa TaxID=172846 RepID=A0AAV4NMM8_CAEEX|nr:hypothetical protein CEXT_241671 [Caerostris extrusa]
MHLILNSGNKKKIALIFMSSLITQPDSNPFECYHSRRSYLYLRNETKLPPRSPLCYLSKYTREVRPGRQSGLLCVPEIMRSIVVEEYFERSAVDQRSLRIIYLRTLK